MQQGDEGGRRHVADEADHGLEQGPQPRATCPWPARAAPRSAPPGRSRWPTRVRVAWTSPHSSPLDASSPRARTTAAGEGRKRGSTAPVRAQRPSTPGTAGPPRPPRSAAAAGRGSPPAAGASGPGDRRRRRRRPGRRLGREDCGRDRVGRHRPRRVHPDLGHRRHPAAAAALTNVGSSSPVRSGAVSISPVREEQVDDLAGHEVEVLLVGAGREGLDVVGHGEDGGARRRRPGRRRRSTPARLAMMAMDSSGLAAM